MTTFLTRSEPRESEAPDVAREPVEDRVDSTPEAVRTPAPRQHMERPLDVTHEFEQACWGDHEAVAPGAPKLCEYCGQPATTQNYMGGWRCDDHRFEPILWDRQWAARYLTRLQESIRR